MVDISGDMMEIVRNKVVSLRLNKMTVGRQLDGPDNTFADDVNLEVYTRVRSSPETFKQLIRIKKMHWRRHL